MAAAVQIVGTVVGGMIGGPVGAQIGGFLGGLVGNAMFPPPAQEGPRMTDKKLTTSAYGMTLPEVYGRARMTGNLVWASEIVEHKHSDSVGKGGGQEVNTYTYTVSLFFAICEGPITGVSKIWANGKLVWDGTSNSASAIVASSKFSAAVRIYLGTEDQMPDPFMQAADGADSTPAYRGTAGVFMQDLDISPWGTVPNFEFEIVAHGSAVGPRLLTSGYIKLEQAGAADRERLYLPNSASFYTGGYSTGYPIIASVSSNALDLVANQISGIDSHSENNIRWTIDEVGNVLGQGRRSVDYSFMRDGMMPFSTGPGVIPGFEQDYQVQWIGRAGELHMFLNRGAPLKIGGTTLADEGTYPAGYEAITVGGIGAPYDATGFFRQLSSIASGFIHGVFPSGDGSVCIVTTGTERFGGESQHWHRFTFAGKSCHYEASGPIDSGLIICGFGRQTGNYGIFESGMVEENGLNLWTVKRALGNPLYSYEIGQDNVMRRTATINLPVTPNNLSNIYSIYASGGVAFVANSRNYASATRLPSVASNTVTLAYIVSEIWKRAGNSIDDIDVSGLDQVVEGVFFANQMSYRSKLETLFTAYFVDAVESSGKLKCVKRGGSVAAVIPEDDLAARDGMSLDAPPDQIKITRQQELELPREMTVDYFAAGADLQEGSQLDSIQSKSSLNVAKVQLPLALSDNEAATICRKLLYQIWAGRETYQFATSLKYSHLEPTDIVTVYKDGQPLTMRITKRTDGGDGVISWEGVSENPTVYEQDAIGGIVRGGAQTLSLPGPTDLMVLDAPAFTDNYGVVPLVYLAGNGFDTTWNGASLLQSFDGGDTYQDTGVSLTAPCIIGRTSSLLPPPAMFGVWDEINTVDVFLSNGAAELSSSNELNVLAGFNTAYIGGEIVGYKVATQIGLRAYRLSGLLRAQRGTEDFAKSHVIGEDFVVLNSKNMRVENIDSSLIGTDLTFKAVTYHGAVSDARMNQKKFTGRNLRPYSPVQVVATKSTPSASGDWVFQWNRRARTGGAWRDSVDVPYTDPIGLLVTGEFEIEIMSYPNTWPNAVGAYVIRTITGLGPDDIAAKYTVAQQTADFGGPTDNVIIRVYQVSATVGRSPLVETNRFVYVPTVFSGGPAVVVTPVGPTTWDSLFRFQGAPGSTTLTDEGLAPFALSVAGDGAMSSTNPKFGISSYDNGTTGYIYSDATSSTFRFGADDKTIGFELGIENYGTGGYLSFGFVVWDTRSSPSDDSGYLLGISTTGKIMLWTRPVGVIYTGSLTVPLLPGAFPYIEMKQVSKVIYFSVNGVWDSVSYANPSGLGAAGPVTILRAVERGSQSALLPPNHAKLGLLRINLTTASHASNDDFQIPSAALMRGNGTNGSTTITDDSYNQFSGVAGGSVSIDTSTFPAGVTTASMKFNGGGSDVAYVPHHNTQNLGAFNKWTIRLWVNPAGFFNSASYVMGKMGPDNANRGYGIFFTSDGTMQFYYSSDGRFDNFVSMPCTLWTNSWKEVHVAYDGDAGMIYFSIGGVPLGSASFSNSIFNCTSDLVVGGFGRFGAGSLSMTGHVAQFRLIPGQCLPATYTPSASPAND